MPLSGKVMIKRNEHAKNVDLTNRKLACRGGLFSEFRMPEIARDARVARTCPSLLGRPNARVAREFRALNS